LKQKLYCLGPIDKATISEIFLASFCLIDSSRAISQNGFIAIFTLASSTPVPSPLTLALETYQFQDFFFIP